MATKASSHSPARWLVMDVHGVLIPSSEKWILRQAAKKTGKGLLGVYWRWLAYLRPAQLGELPAKAFYEKVLDQTLSEKAFQSLIMEKYEERGSISPTTLRQLLTLKQAGWKLAILSDMNSAQAAFHRARKTFALFDQVSFSAENGLMKPFPSAFAALEKRLRARKDCIVFVDDLWFNTLSAQLMGWRAVTVRHGRQLNHFLHDLE